MSELLSGNSGPTVDYKSPGSEGKFITGVLVGHKSGLGRHKNLTVWNLQVIDGDLPITVKVGNVYNPVDVSAGDKVGIFGCTVLNRALERAKEGDVVKIVSKGKGKSSDGKNAPYLFDVTREDIQVPF